MIDVETRGTPGWWLKRLSRELTARRRTPSGWARKTSRGGERPGIDLLGEYLRGDPPLPEAANGWEETARSVLRLARLNVAALSVEAATHRMRPVGFGTAVEDDRDGDVLAGDIFRANQLHLRSADVFHSMLGLGDGYMILGEPADDSSNIPVITAEDPAEVITAEDPRTGRTIAALKAFRDPWDDADLAYIYLPGRVYVARKVGKMSAFGGALFQMHPKQWEWSEADGHGGEAGAPLPPLLRNTVPVYRFRNRLGVAEFEPHLDTIDRINDGLLDRLSIGKLQAFRQRAIKGLPDYDPTGKRIQYPADAFQSSPGALWRLPEDVEIWESQSVDLTPLRMAVKDDVEAFAAATFTPLHYVNPEAAQGSAEGASVMREGHTFRVEDRRARADAALAQVMAGAFAWMGVADRADATRIRTLWEPADRHSLTERMSAATQAQAAGLPRAMIFTDVMGYNPSDLERIRTEQGRDLLLGAVPAGTAQVVSDALAG